MTNSRLLLRLALVSLAALLAAFQTHTYLRHTLCAVPIVDAPLGARLRALLARELGMRSSQVSRVPLARACRAELAQLLVLLDAARRPHDDFAAELASLLQLDDEDALADTLRGAQLAARVVERWQRAAPQTRTRLEKYLDAFPPDADDAPPPDAAAATIASPGDTSFFTRSVVYHRGAPARRTLPLADRFTLVVPTYYNGTRLPGLFRTLASWGSFAELDRVLLWWNDGELPGDATRAAELIAQYAKKAQIAFDVFVEAAPRNSLNNRWRPSPHIRTEAILAMDDDLQPTVLQLRFAFEQWKLDRRRLVGFTPRRFAIHGVTRSSPLWLQATVSNVEIESLIRADADPGVSDAAGVAIHYRYGGCPAQIVLLPMFLHKDRLVDYWSNDMSSARSIVDYYFNGEDLLMNMMNSARFNLPPLIIASVIARVEDVHRQEANHVNGAGSVSSETDHYERRVWAARHAADAIEKMPSPFDHPPLIDSLGLVVLCDINATRQDNEELRKKQGAISAAGWVQLQDDINHFHGGGNNALFRDSGQFNQ